MKKKLLNIFATVFLGVFLVVLFDTSKPTSPTLESNVPPLKTEQKYQGQARIIDGDSIEVADNNTRLLGIDAPEMKQTCFNQQKNEYLCGEISKNFLINLIGKKEVTCYYVGKDMYNRFLSECFIDNVSINEEIIKNGMAVIYSFTSVSKKMEDLERQAQENKLGIWRGAFQSPKDYRKSHKKKKL